MVVWNPTKVDAASDCILKYILTYELKQETLVTGAMALGTLIHKIMEKSFWTIDEKTGLQKPKYKNAEAFANASKAKWDFIARRGIIRGKKINWINPQEPFMISKDIHQICKKVYERCVNDGPPLYSEYTIPPFEIDGRFFNGIIDEIRMDKENNVPLIRDFKTGRRNPGEMKIKYDPQATIYCLFLGIKCSEDEEFRKKLGVSNEEAKQWGGNPIYLSDKIKMQYYQMRDDRIHEMNRSNIQYNDLCKMIDGLEETISKELIFPARGKRCDFCNVRHPCDRLTKIYGGKIPPPTQIKFHGFSPLEEIKPKKIGIQRTLFTKTHKKNLDKLSNTENASAGI